MAQEEKNNIYKKLRDLRRARGFTVNKFAETIGEDYQKVGRIERGRRSITVDYLMKVSKALDTSVEQLLSKDQKTTKSIADHISHTKPLLNEIVILVEKFASHLPPEKKGELISKVFELAAKFPTDQQEIFLVSFFEGLGVVTKK